MAFRLLSIDELMERYEECSKCGGDAARDDELEAKLLAADTHGCAVKAYRCRSCPYLWAEYTEKDEGKGG